MSKDFWKRFPLIPGFDCLKMKQDIQARIYGEIKDLSPSERVAYFNRAGDRLRERGGLVGRDSEFSAVREEPTPYPPKKPGKEH